MSLLKLEHFLVKLEHKKVEKIKRTTSSLPDELTFASSAHDLKKNICTNEDKDSVSFNQNSPPVPSNDAPSPPSSHSPSSVCSSQCAFVTESGSVSLPADVNLSEAPEPEEVRSPVSEAASSSSGSYSVTADISKSEL